MLPLLFYTAFRRYLQARDIVKPVTFALVSANLVNFAGNWVLMYGHWGARGWVSKAPDGRRRSRASTWRSYC